MNTWLTSTVRAYKENFGETRFPVVWDVGSRDGRDGVELAERIFDYRPDFWDRATVACVEANPAQAWVIRRDFPQVVVHEFAASDVDGTAEFIIYRGDEGAVGSSSLDLGWKKGDLEGDVVTVETRRLEGLVPSDVDIMKVDVEGFSLQVLRGLGDKVRNVAVYHIETETWTGSDVAVKEFMAEHGYKLVDEAEEWGGMPDLVFVRV